MTTTGLGVGAIAYNGVGLAKQIPITETTLQGRIVTGLVAVRLLYGGLPNTKVLDKAIVNLREFTDVALQNKIIRYSRDCYGWVTQKNAVCGFGGCDGDDFVREAIRQFSKAIHIKVNVGSVEKTSAVDVFHSYGQFNYLRCSRPITYS